jgi:hypothetical protein
MRAAVVCEILIASTLFSGPLFAQDAVPAVSGLSSFVPSDPQATSGGNVPPAASKPIFSSCVTRSSRTARSASKTPRATLPVHQQ